MVGRTLRVLSALSLATLILVPQPVAAYHEGIHLEVTPEVQSVPVGTTAILTAILVDDNNFPVPTTTDREIDFENEGGANDFDNNSDRTNPDLTCVIPIGLTSCTVEIEGNKTGNALIRAWIDSDFSSVDNSDKDETRYAAGDDCNQRNDRSSDCVLNATNGSPNPGTSCSGTGMPGQLAGTEPDCTDVVQITFTENAAGTLDCDDSGGTDTENETNPSGGTTSATGENPSTEIYSCYVRDQFGNLKGDVFVQVEATGANDPDNGTSYTSPEFGGCTTKPQDDPLTGSVNEKGRCTVSVPQETTPEKGIATICFWVGASSEGADLCASEKPDTGQQGNGSDEGDNLVDVVELTWQNISDLILDCEPETGFSLVNNDSAIDCLVSSPFSNDPVQGVKVNVEVTGANDPDDSNTPGTPDSQPGANGAPVSIGCDETGANGRCLIKHRGQDAGETFYRAWIDDEVNEVPTASGADNDVDQTEGHNEKTTPGPVPEPDSTDVVKTDWGNGPSSIVVSPEAASAAVNDCHEITVTATDKDGNPAGGVRIDIEQKHERFMNSTPSDEPIVGFCTPVAGPNPSDVDTSLGDLAPAGGGPNTSGTAGGESVQVTDSNGQVTVGVTTQSAQSSNGTGTVYITTWWEATDNDDPSGGEPMDSSLVTWEVASNSATLELTPDLGAADPGSETTYTATVTEGGTAVAGVQVSWAASGTGKFTWTDVTTDSSGQATATVTSGKRGTMTVSVNCAGDFTCSDTSTQNWGPPMCDVMGTEGADTIIGSEASETICGFEGDDVIDGGGGDDVLLGGPGHDKLTGGAGIDELFGATGADLLVGGLDNDLLVGGPDNDLLRGGAGNDDLRGGGGDDRLYGGSEVDLLVGGGGSDSLDGQGGRDVCREGSIRSRKYRC